MSPKTKLTETSDREIVITRVVSAPPELVWDAMTKPEHVVRWWGPNGFTTSIQEMDVRPGGVWKHIMHGPDGTDYDNYKVFKEVVRPSRLVFSHGGSRRGGGTEVDAEATWTFEPVEKNKTLVTIRMVFVSAEVRDKVVKEYGAVEGGNQTLARLGEFAAKAPVMVERDFNAPVEKVWKALTDPNEMKQWYFEELKAFKPEVGFETKVVVRHEDKEFPHLWKVTEVVPNKKIAYSWKYEGHLGESLVSFELSPKGKGTHLKLTHTGLDTFKGDEFPQYARGNFAGGWASLAACLGEHLGDPPADFIISRTFDAPLSVLWKAWTDPEQMGQWWGPRGFTNPVTELDVRVGGAFHLVMRSPEGTNYPCTGFYREVVYWEKLVMSLDCSGHPASWWDQFDPDRDKSREPSMVMLQTVQFEKVGEKKTKLTVASRFDSTVLRDKMVEMGMNEGWSQSLDRLGDLVLKK